MAPATVDQGEKRRRKAWCPAELDELSTPAVDPSQPIQDIAVAGSTDMAEPLATATETAPPLLMACLITSRTSRPFSL